MSYPGSMSVLDLPQLYQRPPADAILAALRSLEDIPTAFADDAIPESSKAHDQAVAAYLTRIVASPLQWIENEQVQEDIWQAASQRLSERSGRGALGAITRTFVVPSTKGQFELQLHEPTLTGDMLGLKTWGSSFALAKQLHLMRLGNEMKLARHRESPEVLELGSGTGLAGLAAACIWQTEVMLTDLGCIVGNLARNIEANQQVLLANGGNAYCGRLDWEHADVLHAEEDNAAACKWRDLQPPKPGDVTVVIASDPVYMPEHPRLLVEAIVTWLCKAMHAIVIIAYPLRPQYAAQIEDLRSLLREKALVVQEEGVVSGRDDWKDQVDHSWSVWGWAKSSGAEKAGEDDSI
ncbi:MAG: hypothetical protein M1828_007507 [Chrysothrix sp. TS-e1954]|nr:MAG: hypothetical protein M1828_007507 [Chrysothrix sp. TS-e1954]